jgi:hypothetical protein
VTSPELLTREEFNQLRVHVTCKDQNCGWTGERTGFESRKEKGSTQANLRLRLIGLPFILTRRRGPE